MNVLNLSTPIGVLVARVGGASLRRGPRGLIYAEGYRFRFPIAGAFTIGNVVTTAHSIDSLACVTPDVEKHEDAHAWQWCALGPFFLPAYLLGMGWSLARTRSLALGNPLERHAGLISGGYLHPSQPDPCLRRSRGRSGAAQNGSPGGAGGAFATSSPAAASTPGRPGRRAER